MSLQFSFIMPVYNNEKYFPKAAQSILEQDCENLELIIIDDGSTDRTPQIADKIAERDSRVRVIHQDNQWIYASFNNGVKIASGDYIYIVNSDDKLRPNILALLERKIKLYHPDVIWTKVLSHICDLQQKILVYDKSKTDREVQKEDFYPDQEAVRQSWVYFLKSGLAQNQANLYRREIMIAHPFRNDVYGADTLFNISIAPDIHSALVLKEPIYDHYVYGQSGLNASVGKYYSYEHNMFSEIYMQYKKLFQKWEIPAHKYEDLIGGYRISELTKEIKALSFHNCPLSTEEKLKKIYLEYADDLIYQCAVESGKVEEFESRILSGTRDLLIREAVPQDSEMYFIYELLESLLRYEKDIQDYKKIEYAINHPLNPMHIGESFYRKLIKDESEEQKHL